MLKGQNVLVVEEEFLIALDIQRMLEDLGAGQMLFARSPQEAARLHERWPSLGLAIVEIRFDGQPSLELATRLRDAGVPIVLSSANSSRRHGMPELPGAPVFVKPMAEDDLVRAIGMALTARS